MPLLHRLHDSMLHLSSTHLPSGPNACARSIWRSLRTESRCHRRRSLPHDPDKPQWCWRGRTRHGARRSASEEEDEKVRGSSCCRRRRRSRTSQYCSVPGCAGSGRITAIVWLMMAKRGARSCRQKHGQNTCSSSDVHQRRKGLGCKRMDRKEEGRCRHLGRDTRRSWEGKLNWPLCWRSPIETHQKRGGTFRQPHLRLHCTRTLRGSRRHPTRRRQPAMTVNSGAMNGAQKFGVKHGWVKCDFGGRLGG